MLLSDRLALRPLKEALARPSHLMSAMMSTWSKLNPMLLELLGLTICREVNAVYTSHFCRVFT
jgi:hypothetical protein